MQLNTQTPPKLEISLLVHENSSLRLFQDLVLIKAFQKFGVFFPDMLYSSQNLKHLCLTCMLSYDWWNWVTSNWNGLMWAVVIV